MLDCEQFLSFPRKSAGSNEEQAGRLYALKQVNVRACTLDLCSSPYIFEEKRDCSQSKGILTSKQINKQNKAVGERCFKFFLATVTLVMEVTKFLILNKACLKYYWSGLEPSFKPTEIIS